MRVESDPRTKSPDRLEQDVLHRLIRPLRRTNVTPESPRVPRPLEPNHHGNGHSNNGGESKADDRT